MSENTSTPWLRIAIVAGLLLFSAVTIATNVIPTRDGLRATQQMLDEQQEANRRTEERTEELRDEADALRTRPWVVNRVIREELNRKDENEIEVR